MNIKDWQVINFPFSRPTLPTDRNMHTETEDYLNCCPDCGTYYRIIQIHHCGVAEN